MMNESIIKSSNKMTISAKYISSISDTGDICFIDQYDRSIKLRRYIDLNKMMRNNIEYCGKVTRELNRIHDILKAQMWDNKYERRYLYIYITGNGLIGMELLPKNVKHKYIKRAVLIDLKNQSSQHNLKTLVNITQLINLIEDGIEIIDLDKEEEEE